MTSYLPQGSVGGKFFFQYILIVMLNNYNIGFNVIKGAKKSKNVKNIKNSSFGGSK